MLVNTKNMTFDIYPLMESKKIKNIAELSYETDIPFRDLIRIANNQKPVVSDVHIKKLCDYFECETSKLLSLQSKERVNHKNLFWSNNKFSNRRGIVYFAKSLQGENEGLTKIGFTQDLKQRIKSLEIKDKTKLELLHYIPTNDAYGTEKLLHTVFRYKRRRGEWFDLTDKDLLIVKEEPEE